MPLKKACADAIGDTETSEMLQGKLNRKYDEINKWCDKHNLKHDYSRELVQEQLQPKNSFTDTNKSATMKLNNERQMSNGLRKSPSKLSNEEIEYVKTIAKDIEVPIAKDIEVPLEILEFNSARKTAFNEELMLVRIKGDIFPDSSGITVRDTMSVKSVLAHEYYGHYKSYPSKFKSNDWRDEFQLVIMRR